MRVLALLGVLGVLLYAAAPVRAQRAAGEGGDEAFEALRHRVIVSEILIAPLDDFASPHDMLATLRRLARSRIYATDGFWRLHLVAFPDPPPDTAEVRVVVSDVTDRRHPREVKVFELDAEPGARALAVRDLVLTQEMGFAPGHDYELDVTRGGEGSPGGKTAVLARGVVTLK